MSDLRREHRTDETGPLDPVQPVPSTAHGPAPWRARLRGRLDPFWALVGVVSVISAIFVAVVSVSSMRSVGPPALTGVAEFPRARPTVAATFVIVQLASYPTRDQAQAAAGKLAAAHPMVKVLNSTDFRPLTPHYFVVYLGPFPDSGSGQAQARAQQSAFSGSLIRTITHR